MFNNMKWAIQIIYKNDKKYLMVTVINSLISGILPVVNLLCIQRVIDSIQNQIVDFKKIIMILFFIFFIQLIAKIIINYSGFYIKRFELKFDKIYNEELLYKLSRLSVKSLETSTTYDLINRSQYDANMSLIGSIKIISSLISVLVIIISHLVLLANYSIILSIITIAIPTLKFLYEKKYAILEYTIEKSNTENNRRVYYIIDLLTNSENYKEIKLYNLFTKFINEFSVIKDRINNLFIELDKQKIITDSFIDLFSVFIDFIIINLLILKTFKYDITMGELILYIGLVDNIKASTMDILIQVSVLYKYNAMLNLIRQFFNLEEESFNIEKEEIEYIHKIELSHVYYKYDNSNKYTLYDVNLTLNKGEFITILGPNGSGKSTLMKIIMGLYTDYQGTIKINNIDIKKIDMKKYRSNISVLFQNYIKYETSIENNIIYGKYYYKKDNDKIEKLLNQLNLTSFLDTSILLGNQFTNGRQISIGEWQKLAIARALYRESDLFIFDEPNASLDLQSEEYIWESIYNQTFSSITLVISHRINNIIKKSNKIIVIKNGKIIEEGNHRELMLLEGYYSKLIELSQLNEFEY